MDKTPSTPHAGLSETAAPSQNGLLALGGASLLCLALGSVHAFSVFLAPLEAAFSASRSAVSLTYSLALATLTLAVLLGPALYARIRPFMLVAAACLLASFGALIAAKAASLVGVWIGYSLLFGAANGLGYGFGLQIAAIANPGREGLAMGVVTAAYALGAALSPALFEQALAAGGFSLAMTGLAAAMALALPVCAGLMHASGARFAQAAQGGKRATLPLRRIAALWIAYGSGVAAGLMAIGHAAGIADAAGWRGAVWITPALLALFNMGGSFGAGWLSDRAAPLSLLVMLPALSAAALLLLTLAGGAAALLCLGIVGLCYGAIIAVFPVAIARLAGVAAGARLYGRVFTAWGCAGLLAPWLAGFLYDRHDDYTLALIVAAALGGLSAAAFYRIARRQSEATGR